MKVMEAEFAKELFWIMMKIHLQKHFGIWNLSVR